MEEDGEHENPLEDDYYTFLNISKNATPEEITNAYRRQSRIYHPDKHTDPELKREAENMFNRTKKAYEVLSDPHQRAIYDAVGLRGLQTDGWQIVQRTKTPQEIREEYECLAKEKEAQELQQHTNPKGSITVNINATDIFSKYDDDYDNYDDRQLFSYLEVSGMTFSQSIEAPLTSKDIATLYGHLSTHNGNGTGSVNVAARRLISSKGWVELDVGAGDGPVVSLKGFRTLTKRSCCDGTMVLHFSPGEAKAGLLGTLAMQLDTNTVGYLSYKAGLQNAMSTIIVRDTNESYTALTIHFGIPHSFISFNYTHKMPEKQLKVRGSVKVGTFGVYLEYGAEKRFSQHSSVLAAVGVGSSIGVQLKIRLRRVSQSYTLLFHLSEEALPAPIFYATVVPLITWSVMKKLVIDPVIKERKDREREKQKEMNKARMIEKQKEAKAATELMKATVSRIRVQEESKGGLIITKALYGRFVYPQDRHAADENMHRDEVIDVTIPLQCLVKDSKLVLHAASKSQLPGFYDPCIGEDKQLLIQYLFHTQTHECIVNDDAPLRIPLPSHKVNNT